MTPLQLQYQKVQLLKTRLASEQKKLKQLHTQEVNKQKIKIVRRYLKKWSINPDSFIFEDANLIATIFSLIDNISRSNTYSIHVNNYRIVIQYQNEQGQKCIL